jgi:hypothetical protein
MADAFPSFLLVSHSLREGSRPAIISSTEACISLPSRIWLIQVHSAIASAHFSRAFPVRQTMVSERIMPGVTSGRWGLLFILGSVQFYGAFYGLHLGRYFQ